MKKRLAKAKAEIDAENAAFLASLPVHEQDQIIEASKTLRGTVRYMWNEWRRGRRGIRT